MLRKEILIGLLFFTLGSSGWSTTQNYRLILTEYPENSILIGWELLAGCPDAQRVYYDTVDHGQDTSAYHHSASIAASYFHQGMESYFSHLINLEPDTRYYFVIAEDEGISSRFWFRTFSNKRQPWRAYWSSPEANQIQDGWSKLAELTATSNPDFILADGLAGLHTETAWREWLQTWQRSISDDGRIVPLLISGRVSNDLRYLFNLPREPIQTYCLSTESAFISMNSNRPLKKKVLRSIPSPAFILGHSPAVVPKLPSEVNLLLTNSREVEAQSPRVFSYPEQQPYVEIIWQGGHLEILSERSKKLLEVYAN